MADFVILTVHCRATSEYDNPILRSILHSLAALCHGLRRCRCIVVPPRFMRLATILVPQLQRLVIFNNSWVHACSSFCRLLCLESRWSFNVNGFSDKSLFQRLPHFLRKVSMQAIFFAHGFHPTSYLVCSWLPRQPEQSLNRLQALSSIRASSSPQCFACCAVRRISFGLSSSGLAVLWRLCR